jgi:hypothetical protein
VTTELRLGPLPKTAMVKLTIAVPAALKADLDRYAQLHSQTWGESTDVIELILHILHAFIARDRGFRKANPSNLRSRTAAARSQ